LLSAFLPLQWCTPYALRLIPLLCSVLNVYLIHRIRAIIFAGKKQVVALETIALSTLPPMYFFAHLYYTDVPSITAILLMLLASLDKSYWLSATFGGVSVLMRQTNIGEWN